MALCRAELDIRALRVDSALVVFPRDRQRRFLARAQRKADERIATDPGGPLEVRDVLAAIRDHDIVHEVRGDRNACLVAAHSREHRVRKQRPNVDHGVARDLHGENDLSLADVVSHHTHPLSEVKTKREVVQSSPPLVSAMTRTWELRRILMRVSSVAAPMAGVKSN